jgi:beta-phosphoglucomutase-like phosphatase (HAD superfamily)
LPSISILPGIAAAVAAGMMSVGFTGGSHCRPDHAPRLAASGAMRVAGTMRELQTILAELSYWSSARRLR